MPPAAQALDVAMHTGSEPEAPPWRWPTRWSVCYAAWESRRRGARAAETDRRI